MNIKNKKSTSVFTALLASLIVVSTACASIMTGCGKEESQNTSATRVVVSTEFATEFVESTDADGNKVTVPVTVPVTVQSYETVENGNSDGANNNSNSNNNSNKSEGSEKNENSSSSNKGNSSSSSKTPNKNETGKNESSKNETNKNESSKNESNNLNSIPEQKPHQPIVDNKVCNFDGEKYAVGDQVLVVYKLKTPEKLENYQAEINYDSKFLSVKGVELGEKAEAGSVLNANVDGTIYLNGSNIGSGYKYVQEDVFVTVMYEIKAAGTTKTNFKWVVATGKSGKAYVENNKAVNGMTLSKEIS